MMNSNTKIGLAHDHIGYELKGDRKESGSLRNSSTRLNPQLYV
jgi:hypothetical protein